MSTLDLDKIDSFRELDQKDSKAALATYAATFGVKLNKQKSFDNMLLDLVEEVPAPKPEKPDVDLDTPVVFDASRDLEEETDVSLMVTPVHPVVQEPEKSVFNVERMEVTAKNRELEGGNDSWTFENDQSAKPEFVGSDEDLEKLSDDLRRKALLKILPADMVSSVLPEHFSPTIILMGAGGSRKGFCTLPWWIFDWINQNPDWKLDPDACPHYSARDTLRSLIYYIQRDGDVTIRETRNSGFHVLK